MKTNIQSARIVDLLDKPDGSYAIALIGVEEHMIKLENTAVEIGDVYKIENGQVILEAKNKIGESADHKLSPECDALRWRRRGKDGLCRMDILKKRHTIKKVIRKYFDDESFIEVDTPLLVHGTTPDATIESFSCDERYLITSSEYQIKRMEVGGFDKSYSFTQNFRRGDNTGPHRNPEFTMIEWARVGDTLASIEADAENFTWKAHTALGGNTTLVYQNKPIAFEPPWQRITVAEAIERYVGCSMPNFTTEHMRTALQKVGISINPSWAEDKYFLFTLLSNHIQSFLGHERPVFLCDWPAFQTPSALEKEHSSLAERSELFVAGIEISDGFPSQTSYGKQIESFEVQQELRRKKEQECVLLDESYLASMLTGLPSGAGMALGFDRLVMLLTNQTQIRQVLAFAWDEA